MTRLPSGRLVSGLGVRWSTGDGGRQPGAPDQGERADERAAYPGESRPRTRRRAGPAAFLPIICNQCRYCGPSSSARIGHRSPRRPTSVRRASIEAAGRPTRVHTCAASVSVSHDGCRSAGRPRRGCPGSDAASTAARGARPAQGTGRREWSRTPGTGPDAAARPRATG